MMVAAGETMRSVRFYVGAEPDIAEVMRQTRRLAESVGFNAIQVSYLATVATELASNLFIHAGGGVFEALVIDKGQGIELVAYDNGPGIADIELALRDGYSTAGGLGCGLPGVKRLMDEMHIESQPAFGTRVCAKKWKNIDLREVMDAKWGVTEGHVPNVGYATRPMPGESACGDHCGVWVTRERTVLALADGLGHGPNASHAADMALRCIGSHLDKNCEGMFAACDRQLLDTRGVALSIAIIDRARACVTVAAVGNVRSVLMTRGRNRRLAGACGIVGAGYDSLLPECLPLMANDVLALYSDGLAELLPLRELCAVGDATPRELAEIALRRWASDDDDASMLIYRHAD